MIASPVRRRERPVGAPAAVPAPSPASSASSASTPPPRPAAPPPSRPRRRLEVRLGRGRLTVVSPDSAAELERRLRAAAGEREEDAS